MLSSSERIKLIRCNGICKNNDCDMALHCPIWYVEEWPECAIAIAIFWSMEMEEVKLCYVGSEH